MSVKEFYKDKVVLITGASMGIGKELARQVLEHGGKAVMTGRNEERLKEAAKEFEQHAERILLHAGDVSDYGDNVLLMEKIDRRFGKLDILINNAGLSCFGELDILKPEVIKQVIDTNLYGPVYQSMTALKKFKSGIGSVLFVSSIAAFRGLPGYAAYSLSKLSLKAFAESLRTELYDEKIFVGITYVGFTENEEHKKTISHDGTLESIPARPRLLLSSREKTAQAILKQIKRRRNSETHSLFGKFLFFMSKFFPSLLGVLMRRKYLKEKRQIS